MYLVIGAGLFLILSNSQKENKNFDFIKKTTPPKSIELVEQPSENSKINSEKDDDIEEEKEKLNK